jgi:hypothetical protein
VVTFYILTKFQLDICRIEASKLENNEECQMSGFAAQNRQVHGCN